MGCREGAGAEPFAVGGAVAVEARSVPAGLTGAHRAHSKRLGWSNRFQGLLLINLRGLHVAQGEIQGVFKNGGHTTGGGEDGQRVAAAREQQGGATKKNGETTHNSRKTPR